jgi:hypothetical protein
VYFKPFFDDHALTYAIGHVGLIRAQNMAVCFKKVDIYGQSVAEHIPD